MVPLARATPSPATVARPASGAIFVATRPSLNGMETPPLSPTVRVCKRCFANQNSRNCTKHNCRCDYMDVATVHDESTSVRKVPDLLMSAEIEVEIKNWHLTGLPPFPELMHFPRNCWSKLSRTDLRLIHHIIGLSIDLHRRGLSSCTIWAQKMPL